MKSEETKEIREQVNPVEDGIWVSSNGPIPVDEMENDHLEKAYAFSQRKIDFHRRKMGYFLALEAMLNREKERRKLFTDPRVKKAEFEDNLPE